MQSASRWQAVRHDEPAALQARLAVQVLDAGIAQAPAPSQDAAGVSVFPLQLWARQVLEARVRARGSRGRGARPGAGAAAATGGARVMRPPGGHRRAVAHRSRDVAGLAGAGAGSVATDAVDTESGAADHRDGAGRAQRHRRAVARTVAAGISRGASTGAATMPGAPGAAARGAAPSARGATLSARGAALSTRGPAAAARGAALSACARRRRCPQRRLCFSRRRRRPWVPAHRPPDSTALRASISPASPRPASAACQQRRFRPQEKPRGHTPPSAHPSVPSPISGA